MCVLEEQLGHLKDFEKAAINKLGIYIPRIPLKSKVSYYLMSY